MHTALHGCAQHSHTKQCAYSEAQTHGPIVKHTQHTVNPLITLNVNPFLPSAISTVSVFLFSTNHCIGATGDVSDTMSVSPSCQNARRSPAISR
ncbi:unnamed protein product [Staurois parvus]|uniref:Uncharacterized protein n=1 Tax=Staurois parvus TaxID=386267 RepID=A0ABN9CXI8_9NEOB|nr:unnamed protein product [Staurois parvus]